MVNHAHTRNKVSIYAVYVARKLITYITYIIEKFNQYVMVYSIHYQLITGNEF